MDDIKERLACDLWHTQGYKFGIISNIKGVWKVMFFPFKSGIVPFKIFYMSLCNIQDVQEQFKELLWRWKRGCLLLPKVKANTVSTCLMCEIRI